MAIFFVFLCGIVNFAMHKAVLESGHPLLEQVPWYFHMLGGRFSFAVEFVMLAGAMLMIANGSPGWAWGYMAYSALNGISAWLILSHSV